MKLELKNAGQEITDVWSVGGHVVFRARIKVGLRALYRRSNALILGSQLPPCFVVLFWSNLAGENLPAPLINEQSKRQKGNLVQRHFEQITSVGALRRYRLQQTHFFQVFGSDGERNGVADGFVKAVIRAVLK